jgi:hypothetical protein
VSKRVVEVVNPEPTVVEGINCIKILTSWHQDLRDVYTEAREEAASAAASNAMSEAGLQDYPEDLADRLFTFYLEHGIESDLSSPDDAADTFGADIPQLSDNSTANLTINR